MCGTRILRMIHERDARATHQAAPPANAGGSDNALEVEADAEANLARTKGARGDEE